MEANVTLIIKAANQSVADHRIECESDWTVLLLKNHLANNHPSKPSVKEQRLIYSGQLLVDHLVLRTALRHPSENNSYTIHLVCSPPRHSTPTVTSSAAAATVNPAANMATAASSSPPAVVQAGGSSSGPSGTSNNPTPSESTAASTDSSTDGVRRRFVSPEVTTSTNTTTTTNTTIGGPTPYINGPGVPQFPQELITAGADPMHQMALMQQMYAQYMTSYMQYMQMGGAVSGMMWPGQMLQPATQMAPPMNPQVTMATTATDPQEPLDNNAQPQPPQQQQQNPPQIRMNAQGGEVDEEDENGEEGVGRDWLDWVYMASRCAVLLSIVYFYSTPSRFMLVICIAMLLYLYQAGWFRPARRIEAVPVREGNNNNVNRNDNNNQDDRNNNINNNNNNNNLANEVQPDRIPDVVDGNADVPNPPTNEASARVVEEVPARPSFLALSWTFLTTFFTSLIPEQPQVA